MATYTKTELKEKWELLLETLSAGNLGSLKTKTFFGPLEIMKLSERDGKIYLRCANADFFRNSTERYEEDIRLAVREVFGKDYTLELSETEIEEGPGAPPEEEARPNPAYNFDSFVAGSNNNLALAACIAVADGYSKKYNPLFLYGGSGLGKTHLMHATWQYVLQNHPKKKVLYVTAETFTTELVNAIQTKTQKQFKEKYRKVDYLLFDDVQFIQGRDSTQEELFNIFDALHDAGKQIIFSSDRAPKDLGDLPERLTTRFGWGMLAGIQSPDYETRVAILNNKADLMGLTLDDNMKGVIDVIAQSIQSNIRELEGALTLIVSSASLVHKEINRDFAKEILNSNYETKSREINPALIKRTVASYFNLKVSDLEGSKRVQNIVQARQIAMYLIREYTDYSYPKIGELFGGRDHTTVLHSCEKISEDSSSNENLKNTLENIRRSLNF